MSRSVGLGLLLCLLVCACQRTPNDSAAGSVQSPAPSSAGPGVSQQAQPNERTWVGLLPCSDCQGIDTRLVLRSEGDRRDYLMTETYVGGNGKNSFSRAGTWVEVTKLVDGEPNTLYILDPDQAGQRFALQSDGALELLDAYGKQPAQAVAYRLQRL